MKAIEFKNGELSFNKNLPYKPFSKHETTIRVLCAGICSTDLEIIKGYMGFVGIPGHEFVGIVEKCQDENWVGKRVVGSINAACLNCQDCFSLGEEHCANRTVLGIMGRNGAFAEYLSLPVENIHEVPDNVSDRQAVFTEPLAAALRIYQQTIIDPKQPVAVVGPGRLGLLVAQALKVHGCSVVVLGRSKSAENIANNLGLKYGLTHDYTDNFFNLIIEATGNQEGFAQSLRLARPKGTIILKSTFAEDSSIDMTKIVVSELNVVGSRCGPFPPALRLLSSGSIQTEPFIEATYKFEDVREAFEHASQPGAKKILLRP